MCRTRYALWFLLLGLSFLVACEPQWSLPTAIPTVELPVATSTRISLPPTSTSVTSTPQPTPVPPTRLPTKTPTPVLGPLINVSEPVEGVRLLVGDEVAVSGFAQVATGMSIKAGLSSVSGWSLSQADATIEDSSWQATLPIPEYVTGAAKIHVVILDAGGAELTRKTIPVTLAAERENNESFMTILRPTADAVAVAGHNFFVDGQLWQAGGGFVQVAVFMNECNENVADFSFNLSSSSYWYGYIVLPRDIAGPGCAVAWVGEPGEANWRAAQIPITVLHQDDENAQGILITNPRPDGNIRAGEPLLINGIAYNVPGQTVNVSLSLQSGLVIADATAEVDYFGYWNVEVLIPPEVEGETILTATILDEENFPAAAAEVVFNFIAPSQ